MTKASPSAEATGATAATTAIGQASPARPRVSTRRLVVVGVLVSLFLAGVVSFYASSHPDGLQFVAGEKGFLHSAGAHPSDDSPFAGYSTRGVHDARLSGGIAGVVGATLVFVLAGGLFLAVRRRDRSDASGHTSSDTSSDGDG
jgi:cobalt/nickel transport protein